MIIERKYVTIVKLVKITRGKFEEKRHRKNDQKEKENPPLFLFLFFSQKNENEER